MRFFATWAVLSLSLHVLAGPPQFYPCKEAHKKFERCKDKYIIAVDSAFMGDRKPTPPIQQCEEKCSGAMECIAVGRAGNDSACYGFKTETECKSGKGNTACGWKPVVPGKCIARGRAGNDSACYGFKTEKECKSGKGNTACGWDLPPGLEPAPGTQGGAGGGGEGMRD